MVLLFDIEEVFYQAQEYQENGDLDDVIEACDAKNKHNDELSSVNANIVEKIKGFEAEHHSLTIDKKKLEDDK